jgi:hypothetical protein
MDPSTFWKVLWLISFCGIFDVIVEDYDVDET